MDYFGAFRIFLRVSQMGSLSGVATERGMKVSTVSRQISRLEDTLGVVLFNRTTRGLHLTEAGHELQARASRILSDVEDACVMVTRHTALRREEYCTSMSHALSDDGTLCLIWRSSLPATRKFRSMCV